MVKNNFCPSWTEVRAEVIAGIQDSEFRELIMRDKQDIIKTAKE